MRYFLNYIIALLLTVCCLSVQAQNYPVYNSFYINPFLYNPAEAITQQTQVFAVHRQQWMNVEGAPTLSALSFNTLLNETRAGIGAKFSNYSRGILTTSDISLTYAYGIPFGKQNWFFFGLSGGIISNQIDLEKITSNINPDDPAINNYLENNLQPAANAGILFRMESGLNLGISLPQLFTPAYNLESSFANTSVSPADNIFVTLYYRRKLESRVVSRRKGHIQRRVMRDEAIAPLELYANYKYSKFGNSQAEFLVKLNLANHFWVGASYKLPYGFTGNLGITTPRFMLGYSYEPGNQPEEGFSQGTHEIALGLKLGKQKKFKRKAPVLRSTITTTQQRHVARFQESTADPDKIVASKDGNAKVYLVVIRAFTNFDQADAFKRSLREDKFNAEVYYHTLDKKYYVHVLQTEKSSEAHEEIRNLKSYTKLKTARLMVITVKK